MAPLVFLVDDDASVRRSLERVLRQAGHRVESFASAREFLASDRHVGATACLLLDLFMPGIWDVTFTITLASGPTETLKFTFCVDG